MSRRGGPQIDLTGQRFGRLVVLGYDKTLPRGITYWRCRCDCGTELSVRGNHLKTGNTTSCGCKIHDIEDLTGNRYGRWTVIEFYDMDQYGNSRWLCECDCGTRRPVTKQRLQNGRSKSCGCFKAERDKERHITHGMSTHRLYKIWRGILDRCTNEGLTHYDRYGGRGITVCDEWYDFENFSEWALNNGYESGLTIDRIDNNDGYYPENCRWADRFTQQNNRRNNRHITYCGETHTIAEWSRIFGIEYATFRQRISREDMRDFKEYFGE